MLQKAYAVFVVAEETAQHESSGALPYIFGIGSFVVLAIALYVVTRMNMWR